jgi:hypothetical protein
MRGKIVLTDSNDSFDEMNEYSGSVNQMYSMVVIVSTLEFMSGVIGCVLTIIHFSIRFYPAPLVYIVAAVSYGVILGALAISSLIAGLGLWRLEPWSWRIALAINVASLATYLPVLNPIMVPFNIILIWLLRKLEIQNAYADIELP